MVATVHKLHDLPSDKPILVPEGVYSLAYTQHVTWLFKGMIPKLIVSFSIQDFGEYHLQQLNAYYNAKKLTGKPKKDGHFSAGWRSDFMMDYSTCFGTPVRTDRFSMCRFKNVLVEAQVRTVTRNRDQRLYPDGMKYSVIDHIIGTKQL